MERKRIGVVLMALCLFLGFSVIAAEAAPKDKENTAKKCSDGMDNDGDGKIDGEDPDCKKFTGDDGGGGGGSGGGGKHERITVWFQDGGGYDLQSDGLGNVAFQPNCEMGPSPCYIDGEQKVKAHIGGLVQPNPAGIRLEPGTLRGIKLGLDDNCQDGTPPHYGCDNIPVELTNSTVVHPWTVRAGAYSHSDDPQLIPVGDSENYHFRVTVQINRVRWLIEVASTRALAGENGFKGALCPEAGGQDVTVESLADTNGDGLSDKWRVTADPKPGDLNARVCADLDDDGDLDLVARLRMTFEYIAQLK